MSSPSNLAAVPIVTYVYLFCLPLSKRPQPPARRKALGLLAGSCTLGIATRQLRPKNLDMTDFLQRQTTGEPSTLYRIWSHHS
jgi:hypothetical protein